MVKNKKGGSSHKKMARKNVAPKGGYNKKLRKAVEEGEMYARVTAMLGGGHARIICADGKERTLVIRGKFRGRNKRDNTLKLNTFVLVGLQSVSFGAVIQKGKLEKADLLEVYRDGQKEELIKLPGMEKILDDESKVKQQEDLGFDVMTASESFMEEVISEEDKSRLKHNKKIEKERKKMAKKVVEEEKVEDKKIKFDMELDWDDI